MTAEQRAILDSCPPPSSASRRNNSNSSSSSSNTTTTTTNGQLTRITAAAGAGKTTTLLHLALKGFELGHTDITYLTFTNAAAQDGSRRLHERLMQQQQQAAAARCHIDARTLHSCAKKQLNAQLLSAQHEAASNDDDKTNNAPHWTDKQVKKWILRCCQDEMETFLVPCFRTLAGRGHRSTAGSSSSSSGHHSAAANNNASSMQQRAREQVEFFLYKSLVHFCQSNWSLQEYKRGERYDPVTGTFRERIFNRDYYPAKKFHTNHHGGGDGEKMGFAAADYSHRIDFYAQQVCRLWEIILRDDIRCHDFEMKRVQLNKIRIPGTLLLVDESQDMDAAQIDWVSTQVRYGTHVYVVGDPAQAIYGFRGARPSFLMSLDHVSRDCKLTDSWRFGANIANIANLVLYAKEKSPQTAVNPKTGKHKNWIPYRTRPGMPKHGRVTDESLVENWKTQKVTVLARTNAKLLLVALDALGIVFKDDDDDDDDLEGEFFNEQVAVVSAGSLTQSSNVPAELPKIHINGKGESSGLSLWRRTLKQIESVYQIYASKDQGASLPNELFPEFSGRAVTWKAFVNECDSRELTRYSNAINVVEKLTHRTLEAMESFKEHVMDNKYTEEEAHIILSTCHSAKGMEWNNVQVCDDFINLHEFQPEKPGNDRYQRYPYNNNKRAIDEAQIKWQFAFDSWGDDVNLAYVACTRAKKVLSLPPCIFEVLKVFDSVHSVVSQPKGKVNEFVLLPGYKEPLDIEKLRPMHAQLIVPLRKELALSDKVKMYSQLVQSNQNQSTDSTQPVIEIRDDDDDDEPLDHLQDEKPPAKKTKISKKTVSENSTVNDGSLFAPVDVSAEGSNASNAIEILD